MRVVVAERATRGVPTLCEFPSWESPKRRSAFALALVALHRSPLLTAESGLALGDQGGRVVSLEQLADPRPGKCKVGLPAPQLRLTPLKVGLQALDACRRAFELRFGAGASAERIAQLSLEDTPLNPQLVGAGVFFCLPSPVGAHTLGLTGPLPGSAWSPSRLRRVRRRLAITVRHEIAHRTPMHSV